MFKQMRLTAIGTEVDKIKMLSQVEKLECQQILHLLSDEDIFSLAATATGHVVKVGSRSEGENAILTFADSTSELLNRQKISKGVLINYCLKKLITVPATARKSEIVEAIISCWDPSKRSQASSKPAAGNWQNKEVLSTSKFGQNWNASSHLQHQQKPNITSALRHQQEGTTARLSDFSSSLTSASVQHVFVQNIVNFTPVSQTNNVHVGHGVSQGFEDASRNQTSAEEFVKWFYEMLNSCNPAFGKANTEFGAQHFCNNAQLFLVLNSSTGKEEEEVCGNSLVAERLFVFPKSAQLLFNPNVSSQGVAMRSSSHGVKLILVCGTFHKVDQCLGIFQQSFALVSDPLNPGSWKVKVTCLKMDQCLASMLPKLQDCAEIQAMEAHTTRTLQRL